MRGADGFEVVHGAIESGDAVGLEAGKRAEGAGGRVDVGEGGGDLVEGVGVGEVDFQDGLVEELGLEFQDAVVAPAGDDDIVERCGFGFGLGLEAGGEA